MVGSGIFLLPASLAFYGGISLVGWLCASVGAILLAIVFGNLAKIAPDTTGGPYSYTKLGVGQFPAYLVAWGYWVSIWCTNASIATAFVGYLEVFFPIIGEEPWIAISIGLSVIWLFTWINSKPMKTVAMVQLVTTILKVTPIVLIGFIGVMYIKTDHFIPFNLSGETNMFAITATTTATLFAFLGMESATIPSSQVENAAKTIKKATMFGTLLTIVIYITSTIAIMGIIPPEVLAESNAPFADVAALFWGSAAKYIVAIGALIATLGALNGWILIQGQIPMAAAQDNLFPSIFKRTNKHKSPILGIILSSILASIVMGLKYNESLVNAFTFMMNLSTLSVLTPYLLSALSLIILIKKRNTIQNKTRNIIIAILSMLFCVWVIFGSGMEVILWGIALLVVGIPFYFGLNRKND